LTLQVHESELLKEESAKKTAADEARKAATAQAVAEAKVWQAASTEGVHSLK
jgi:hypothetical protein